MKSNEHYQTMTVDAVGTVMIVTWFLVLGPLGALLLGGTAYFITAENIPAVMLLCGLLFAPIVLTFIWGAMKLLSVLRERRLKKAAFLLAGEALPPSSELLET